MVNKKRNGISQMSIIGLLFFICLIIVSPYIIGIYSKVFDNNLFGGSGPTLALIISPFIGLLSAFIIYLSFISQKKSSELQFKINKYESDLTFIYYRLSEIQDYNQNQKYEKSLFSTDIIENLYSQIKGQNDKEFNLKIIQKYEDQHIVDLTLLIKYLNIFLIIEKKIDEIHNQVDKIQLDYIRSSIIYEYSSISRLFTKTSYLLDLKEIFDSGIPCYSLFSQMYLKSKALVDFIEKIKMPSA
jgi:hypothetical protein